VSNLGSYVLRLVEAGANPGIAAEIAAEIFISGVQSAPLRVDVAAERRREKDRERKRSLRGNPQIPQSPQTAMGKKRFPL
jgi:hypothetical protein